MSQDLRVPPSRFSVDKEDLTLDYLAHISSSIIIEHFCCELQSHQWNFDFITKLGILTNFYCRVYCSICSYVVSETTREMFRYERMLSPAEIKPFPKEVLTAFLYTHR